MSDIAISEKRRGRLEKTVQNRLDGLTIVAEGTHLRHNLSAIIRTAESFGVSTVHLISAEKQKMSGAAKGAERWVELIIHSNTEQCFEYLKIQGYQIFVTDFQEDSYTPETAPVDRPVAIVMGTELIGVSETAKKLSDGSIVIPMYGLTQSLNVSVASACVLQRLSTRMREARVGLMSVENQDKLLTIWLQRDQQEKINRRNRHDLARK